MRVSSVRHLPSPDVTRDPNAWKLDGLCTQFDPDLWFPDRGQPAAQAKQICASCPVVDQCLAYAVGYPEQLPGVWGGLAERERQALRTTRRVPRPHHERPAANRSPKVRCDCGGAWCTGVVAKSTRAEHQRRLRRRMAA